MILPNKFFIQNLMSINGISLQNFNGVNHKIIDLTKYSTVWGYPKFCHHNVIVLNHKVKHENNKIIPLLFNNSFNQCKYNRLASSVEKAEELLNHIQELESQSKSKEMTLEDKINFINSFNRTYKIKLLPGMSDEKINEAFELVKTCNNIINKIQNNNEPLIKEINETLNKLKSFNC